jgi:hypothetical protein
VTSPRSSFDDRHGLRDFLLGLYAVASPLLAHVAAPAPANPNANATRDPHPAPPDDVTALLLGLASFAWHLEPLVGVAAREPIDPDAAPPPHLRDLLR